MIALRVFIPFALGYFLSYLLRVVNAVIAPDLVAELGLTAADLGLLTSANFLAFAAAQLPLGILLDRYGPRRTEAALLLFAALGAFIFAHAASTSWLMTGRALIGLGTSACLMAAFKAYVMWFSSDRIPLINGLQMTAGGLGAVTGTIPVEAALQLTDWRGLFIIFSAAALVFSAAIFFVVPKRLSGETSSGSMKDQLDGFRHIFVNPRFWRIAPMTIASQSMFLGTQSLWSGPWLADVGGLGRADVAQHLLLIAIAMVAGFLSMGIIAERLGRIGVNIVTVAFSGMMLFAIIQVPMALQWTGGALPMWMLFGFLGTCGILPYAALPREFPSELAGRVITGLNVFTFSGAFACQWSIGAIINLWPATSTGGYAPEGYQAAFWVMIGIQALGLMWYQVYRKN